MNEAEARGELIDHMLNGNDRNGKQNRIECAL